MSRIGRMPIAIPAGVTVEIAENNNVTVKGRRWSRCSYKTKRFKEDEIITRINQNTDPQHGCWCY